jgi:hypothetical protein
MFGIPNPGKYAEGVIEYQALGGGAELTDVGKSYLEGEYGASGFEKDKGTGVFDARFRVEEEKLEQVFRFFSGIAGQPNRFEMDPTRDILTELTGKEFPTLGVILEPTTAGLIQIDYVDTVRQRSAEDGIGTSERSQAAGVPTRRLFRRYKLVMPVFLAERMLGRRGTYGPIARRFTDDELVTTNGGATKGITSDGKVIRDNLFIPAG